MNFKFAALATTIMLSASLPAAAITIDNFNNNGTASSTVGVSTAVSGVSGTAIIIGGERDLASIGLVGGGAQQTVIESGSSNFFEPSDTRRFVSHSQTAFAAGASNVVWDGADGDGLMTDFIGLRGGNATGVDLTAGGDDALTFDIVLANEGGNVFFFIFTDELNFSFFRYDTPEQDIRDPSTPQTIAFSSFLDASLNALPVLDSSAMIPQLPLIAAQGGADFSNVGSIMMVIDGSASPNFDFAIDLLETTRLAVPVPASMLLLVMGGLLLRRKRHTTS